VGVAKLSIYHNECFTYVSWVVAWSCFKQDIIGVTEEGRPKNRIKEAFKETSTSMFLDYLRPKLHQFIMHNFVARWQDNQCKLAMANLPFDCILSHIDFAENYTFQIQNEIQSMHWHSFQVIILVHITFCVDFAFGFDDEDNTFIKDNHFYILDDKEHDTLFV
jgi:hypothetical protein